MPSTTPKVHRVPEGINICSSIATYVQHCLVMIVLFS